MAETAKTNGWVIDLAAWTHMEPFYDWQDHVRTGNLRAMAQVMTTVIKSWPFEGDPADADTYAKNLRPTEWQEAAKKVGSAVGDFFSS